MKIFFRNIVLSIILITLNFSNVTAFSLLPIDKNKSKLNFNLDPVSAGSLDTTFDNDGLVTTSFGTQQAFGNDVALQDDGKIVVAGQYAFNFALARYNNDGSLDTTFDNDGLVTTDFVNADGAYALAIQDDGKIVAAGYRNRTLNQSDYEFALARYNTDGSLDTFFDGDGKVTTNLGNNYDYISEIAIQPSDGKIIVVGSKNIGINDNNIVVARYNIDGSLDNTFDEDGIFTSNQVQFGSSVIIQPDGKILVNGLIRLNSDGSLDTDFGNNGFVNADGHIALQADGRIIVAKTQNDDLNSVYNVKLSRYNTNGTLDTNFGTNGHSITEYGDSYNSIQDITIQNDQKIIFVGYNRLDSFNFNILRYTSNGFLDESFSFDGIEYTNFGNQEEDDDFANAVTIQPDGNIIVAGSRYHPASTEFHFALARYIGRLVSVVSIKRTSVINPTNASSISFTVKFSEPVIGVDNSDFALTTGINISGAFITGVTGSGDTYTVTVNTGSGDGNIRLRLIDDDSIEDLNGNKLSGTGIGNGNFTTGEGYSIVKEAPLVNSIIRANLNPTNSAIVEFTVTFTESVTGVSLDDFVLLTDDVTDAFISSVNGTGSSYTVTANTGINDGTIQLVLIDDNSIRDTSNHFLGGQYINDGDFYHGEIYSVIKSYPVVTSILRTSSNPTSSLEANFIINFSQAVTGVDITDFSLISTGVTGATITEVDGLGTTYTVNINTGDGSGTIRLDLIDNDSIIDINNTSLGGSGVNNGDFITGELYTVIKKNSLLSAPRIPSSMFRTLTGDTTPVLLWSNVQYASAYKIVISQDKTFNTIIVDEMVFGVNFTPISPLADGVYYWRVYTLNGNLQPGKASVAQTLTIDTTAPSIPILTSPADGAELKRSPILRWTRVTGGVIYELQVSTSSDFSSATTYTLRTNSRNLPALPDNIYYWRVRVKDAVGNWSDWSPHRTFEIDR